eukprot:gene37398-45415_t
MEMNSSPMHDGIPHTDRGVMEKETPPKSAEEIKNLFDQMVPPMYKKVHTFDPTFMKCDGKIVKYESREMHVWKALVSFSHTILSDGDTWSHLSALTVICFIAMGICIATGSYKSIYDSNSVVSRIQLLISFVFAAYITLVINRWDRVRNVTLGQVWGAIENLNLLAYQLIQSADKEQDDMLCELILRYSRLCLQLLFKAAQNESDLANLKAINLLTDIEEKYLLECSIGTRPLVLVSWIHQFFVQLKSKYKYTTINEIVLSNIISNVASLRGGIGATLGAIGTQLPYPYVHVVYWTIQILLLSLAVETGVMLAVAVYTRRDGNGAYSPSDDNEEWPQNQDVWYANNFLQLTAQNIVFALFCEGLLKICDKLSNPMSKEDTSFSERVYDSFMFNNCRAMRAGNLCYEDIAIPLASMPKAVPQPMSKSRHS